MRLIAITGSIGCGKTTISNILRKQGFLVYDVDKWVKYLYYKKNFLQVIKTKFPEVFENNVLNKRCLRNLVFNNSEKLKILESVIHPILLNKLRMIVRKHRNHGIIFVDVALLYEMGWEKYFEKVILADVEPDIQRIRVMERDHITSLDFDKINNIQISRDFKKKNADIIINTGVDLSILQKNIIKELQRI